MLNLIVSTIVFFIASWYIKRYLDEQEIPKGMTRGVVIFTLAALLSWGVGWSIDWAQGMIEGPQTAAQNPSGLSQILKAAGQSQR
ncbi:MAG: hypothetical protein WBQ69_00115 [Gallionella sp.]